MAASAPQHCSPSHLLAQSPPAQPLIDSQSTAGGGQELRHPLDQAHWGLGEQQTPLQVLVAKAHSFDRHWGDEAQIWQARCKLQQQELSRLQARVFQASQKLSQAQQATADEPAPRLLRHKASPCRYAPPHFHISSAAGSPQVTRLGHALCQRRRRPPGSSQRRPRSSSRHRQRQP